MTGFREIQLEDREWVERCRNVRDNPFSALAFPSLFTWKNEYGLTIAGDEDFFVVKSLENKGFFAPCGDKEKSSRFMEEIYKKEGKLRILYLTKEQAEGAEKEGFTARKMPELSEYTQISGQSVTWP